MAIDFVNRPSNRQTYDLFWSGDPAFIQGKGEDHDRKVERAQETGDWSPLLIQGQTPTKFVARQLPGDIKRKLFDRWDATGSRELDSLIVRLAIVDVVGFGDFQLAFAKHDAWGRMASLELPNALDDFAPSAVQDLAVQIFRRMSAPSGK